MNSHKRRRKNYKAHLRMLRWWGVEGTTWTSLENETQQELSGFYHNIRNKKISLDQYVAKRILECDEPSKEVMYYVNCKRRGTAPKTGDMNEIDHTEIIFKTN